MHAEAQTDAPATVARTAMSRGTPAILEVWGDRRENRLFMNGYLVCVDISGEEADRAAE